ncbi:HVO_0234 family beta-propeller protein [Halorubrum trueperi]|uniref:HVO-0234-like beta-propeller domain-containing protein n=1 Tax=Halorubrum trueperi TaxID=2004704 RepID=A0ABD5UNP8_9EURY
MAPAEDDISIEEKRVYAGAAGRTDAYVATGGGVVRVSLSADKVGAFDMVAREPARDIAVLPRKENPDLIGAATADGLLVAAVGDDPEFEPFDSGTEGSDRIGAEPAVAVGACDGAFLVAGEDGGIDRIAVGDATAMPGDSSEDSTATRIGTVRDPRAIDGPLVAAADGVYRIVESDGIGSDLELSAVGLDDARDVAGAGMPLAATASGLYWLGNGWMTARSGDAAAVAADGDGHAMAVVDGDLLVHPEDAVEWETDTWRAAELPVDEEPTALGYGPGVSVAVTAAGTLCVDAGDGWRHQVVGVREVEGVALAVVE